MNNADLISLLDGKIKESVGGDNSPLQKERTDILRYYTGTEPKPYHKGNSKYVSLDVYDSVEAMKAQLLETFANGDHAVRFAPQGPEDVDLADVATKYCDFVVHRQNDGFTIFGDTIHDALLSRVGVVKAYWRSSTATDTEDYKDIDVETFMGLLQDENVELLDFHGDETTGTLTCKIARKRDTSQVCIDVVPPEEFLIEKGAVSPDNAFLGHRTRKSYSELLSEGYPAKLLDKITDTHPDCLNTEVERIERHVDTSPSLSIGDPNTDDDGKGSRRFYVTECYPILDLDDTGIESRWKIIKVADVILLKEKVSRTPFHFFVPLKMPHVFWGANYASKAQATQNAKTVLTRSILDHAVITNNPRWQVLKGALPNVNEMLDNRVGGLVNVTRPDGLIPLPQHQLNPYIFDAIRLLDDGQESRMGISRLSQGLNKDAVSKQNSAALVEQLSSMSMTRQKIIARNFAINFLRPLYLHIYELVLANERSEKVFEVAGNFVKVSPAEWAERKDVVVEFRLGYGERDKDAERLMMVYQMFGQDQALQPMFQEKHRYALLTKMFDTLGVKDSYKYLARPEEVKPPEPDPMVVAQLQIQQKQADASMLAAQTAHLKVQLDHEFRMAQLAQATAKTDADVIIKTHAEERKDFEAHDRSTVAHAELDIARQEAANNAANTKTIISPN